MLIAQVRKLRLGKVKYLPQGGIASENWNRFKTRRSAPKHTPGHTEHFSCLSWFSWVQEVFVSWHKFSFCPNFKDTYFRDKQVLNIYRGTLSPFKHECVSISA